MISLRQEGNQSGLSIWSDVTYIARETLKGSSVTLGADHFLLLQKRRTHLYPNPTSEGSRPQGIKEIHKDVLGVWGKKGVREVNRHYSELSFSCIIITTLNKVPAS